MLCSGEYLIVDVEPVLRVRDAVVRLPRPADGELVEAQHVHHAHRRQRRAEEVRPLRHARRRPAGRRCCRRRWRASASTCSCSRIRHSAAAMKSSKTFCLLLQAPGVVPRLAVLAAAAQVGHGVDAAHLQPRRHRRREAGRERDVEAAVAVEVASGSARRRQALPVGEEHRDLRAVLRRVEDLHGLVLRGVEVHLRLLEDRARARREVVPDRWWSGR